MARLTGRLGFELDKENWHFLQKKLNIKAGKWEPDGPYTSQWETAGAPKEKNLSQIGHGKLQTVKKK